MARRAGGVTSLFAAPPHPPEADRVRKEFRDTGGLCGCDEIGLKGARGGSGISSEPWKEGEDGVGVDAGEGVSSRSILGSFGGEGCSIGGSGVIGELLSGRKGLV